MTKFSVIIINYNNSYNLKKCLESLLSQKYNHNLINTEMVIVDSGSADNSLKILSSYKDRFKIIYSQNRLTPAQARNLGVNNATGNILIFSDSDCCLPLKWLEKYALYFLTKHQIDCVCGTRFPDLGAGAGAFDRRYNFILYSRKFSTNKQILINKETTQKGAPLILIAANNFAAKREAWEKIGGMKTCFKRAAGEDILMQIELLACGYNILFAPDIKVFHNHPMSFLQLIRKAFYQGESLKLIHGHCGRRIVWKHLSQLRRFQKHLTISVLLILSFIIFPVIPFVIKIMLFVVFLSWAIIYRLGNLRSRLRLALRRLDKDVRKTYDLSWLNLFYFDIIDFLAKFSRLLGFVFCNIKHHKNAHITKTAFKKR